MIEIKSINNPIYVASALQLLAHKSGYDVVHTYLTSASVTSKSFNPVFLLFRCEKDGKLIAYISFRTTSGHGGSKVTFSSIELLFPDFLTSLNKFHIKDFDEDTIQLVTKVIDQIKTV